MPKTTKPRNETVIYTHRNFPARMRSRMRVLASMRETTMEAIVLEGLTIGLAEIEKQVFGEGKKANMRTAQRRAVR